MNIDAQFLAFNQKNVQIQKYKQKSLWGLFLYNPMA